ncbi:MAG: hypothetical protein AAFV53_33850 [Myxococcota bacterium]
MVFSFLFALTSAASAAPESGCYLADSLDGAAQTVIIESLADGECSVELDDGQLITIREDDKADTCRVVEEDGGVNIILIWPSARVGASCGGGINIVVIWPE